MILAVARGRVREELQPVGGSIALWAEGWGTCFVQVYSNQTSVSFDQPWGF